MKHTNTYACAPGWRWCVACIIKSLTHTNIHTVSCSLLLCQTPCVRYTSMCAPGWRWCAPTATQSHSVCHPSAFALSLQTPLPPLQSPAQAAQQGKHVDGPQEQTRQVGRKELWHQTQRFSLQEAPAEGVETAMPGLCVVLGGLLETMERPGVLLV